MGVQPPNFSWVLPGRLAGLALPRLPAHYQFLSDLGVRHLVSLTERGPPHSDSCPGLTLHRLRIPDFCPPAPDQIDRFVQIVDEANARGEMLPSLLPYWIPSCHHHHHTFSLRHGMNGIHQPFMEDSFCYNVFLIPSPFSWAE
ncbi:PREDICTED: dual specificity protein phosphatase 23 isoform X2 [Galeopterus variegatus]|uniref:Dual specificity protein phosphatase 23 isoform X2 n=1 Tax=Galeopterus variegatus TaxID=482537 RepID=A0ABM0QHB4_GALVR|nr:PREDICTED: dual specificity protein phosphatase 23 isoform X2 [Galeopterus variegatus]